MTQMSRNELIARERKLAKYANMMDSMIRIPFTRKGVGLDALLSLVPVLGDAAGFILTLYTFRQARAMGLPAKKLTPALRLAVLDAFVGSVPVIGTLFDIFIKPSRRTLELVRDHLAENEGITDTSHIEHPFLHEKLSEKQKKSKFWRNPVAAWAWLHMSDILLVVFIGLVILLAYGGFQLLLAIIDMARTA
ncbi:DUF4112 domain-containing protein [Cardiobacteriaceae bacterium TAE3-ERU3]|nr:DUF4112 domain-containing protein [Cardiobacteriaceae bacterium TAE3-ERU3]